MSNNKYVMVFRKRISNMVITLHYDFEKATLKKYRNEIKHCGKVNTSIWKSHKVMLRKSLIDGGYRD